jgi:predicted thioesterase
LINDSWKETTMTLEAGLTAEIVHTVTEEDSAASYGSGLMPVLSTPHLVALMERTARKAIEPELAPGENNVGIRVDIKHLAATPVGMEVRIRAELLEVDGRRLRFRVEAWDEAEKIGEGHHERFIIDETRFIRGIEKKAEGPTDA